jgi:hypothetical protein
MKWRSKFIFALLFLGSLFSIQMMTLSYQNRFKDVGKAMVHEQDKRVQTIKEIPIDRNENSVSQHVKIWKSSLDLIAENPFFGVGTGDIKDQLSKSYEKNNFQIGVLLSYNSHNQFLNTWVALGIPGLISLLLIFYLGVRISIQKKDWVYFSFILIMILNCLTESVLEKQAGIFFFSAFNMMLYLRCKSIQPTVQNN